jgi:hypothetical protein
VFFLCERRRRRRIWLVGDLSVSHAAWDVDAMCVLARCCPGRTNEETPLSSASKRGRQRIPNATARAERAISSASSPKAKCARRGRSRCA